jgi:signal transduction histidine kinase
VHWHRLHQPDLRKLQAVFCRFILLLAFSSSAQAQHTLQLSTQDTVSLQPVLSWYLDASATADIAQIYRRLDEFIVAPGKTGFARSEGAYWLFFRLEASAEAARQNWLLELDHSQLNRVDFYQRSDGEKWHHQAAGDATRVSSLQIPHHKPLVRIKLNADFPTEIFIRVQSTTSIITPLTLWQQPAFELKNHKKLLVSGIIYGIFFALIFYNLFLFPTVRDRAYLWFSLYLAGFVFFQMAHQGYARQYLWPESPAVADRAASVALWLCLAGGLRFTQFISISRQLMPRLDRIFSMLAMICLSMVPVVIFTGPGPTFFLLLMLAGLIAVLIPVPLFVAWRSHYRPARYALLAFLPILPGAILLIARASSLIEPSFWTEQLLALGTAAASLLLSFALADRISLLREEKQRAQQGLLQIEQSANRARMQFTRRLLSAQDEERKRIATELHDGVGQSLSWLVNALKKRLKTSTDSTLDNEHQVAQETVREIRNLSHQLHPYILDQLGLKAAIESVSERMQQQSGIVIRLDIDDEISLLQPEQQLHVYRIIQEALSNAVRHSKAQTIDLSLKHSGQLVQLNISDNGVGLLKQSGGRGLGLESIRHRVELLSGDISFNRNTPQGLQIAIQFPAQATI